MDEPLVAADSPWAWLVWVFAYAVSLGLLTGFVRSFSRARTAAKWPLAHGRVLRVTREADDGVTSIDIEYEFEVGGVTYRGDRFRFGGGPYYRRRTVEAILARHAPGAAVQVRYESSNPANCVLETHFEWAGWVPALLFGAVVFVVWTYRLVVDPPPLPWEP